MGWVQCGAGIGQVVGLILIPLAAMHSDLHSVFLIPAILAVLLFAVQGLKLKSTRSTGKQTGAMGDVFNTAGFKPFLAFVFLAFLANYAISGWLPTYLRNDFGFSAAEAGLAASLSAIAMAVSSPMAGALSDRLGARKPVLLAGSAMSVLCFGIMVFSSDPIVIVLAALFKGVGTAMTTPVSQMFAGETFAAAGAGIAVGISSTTAQLASSASGPVFGYALDATRSFSMMWSVALACIVASMLFIASVKEHKWEDGEGKK